MEQVLPSLARSTEAEAVGIAEAEAVDTVEVRPLMQVSRHPSAQGSPVLADPSPVSADG